MCRDRVFFFSCNCCSVWKPRSPFTSRRWKCGRTCVALIRRRIRIARELRTTVQCCHDRTIPLRFTAGVTIFNRYYREPAPLTTLIEHLFKLYFCQQICHRRRKKVCFFLLAWRGELLAHYFYDKYSTPMKYSEYKTQARQQFQQSCANFKPVVRRSKWLNDYKILFASKLFFQRKQSFFKA